MKNKLIVVIAIATTLAIATVAMASGNLISGTISTDEIFTPSFDRLAAFMDYDTDEKFSQFHKTAVFMGKYCTTKESFSFIENMILSGCDVQTTMDIYQFYLTTNEPISIVKQIYDMVYNGEPITNRDIIFENAFNQLTNNKCGVLSEEDVIYYIEKGLTVSDISDANLLSRKGVMTIQEILDAILSGTSWEEIVSTVSGEKITSTHNSTDSTALTRAMSIASLTDEPIDTVLTENVADDYFEEKIKAVNKTLKSKGYWKGRKSDNYEIIVEKAESKGVSREKVNALLDNGYNELDILNSIESQSCTPSSIDALVKERSAQ